MCLFKTKILMNTRLKCKISKIHEDHGVTSGWLCLLDWVSIKCISSFSMYHQITPNKWHDVLFGLMSFQINCSVADLSNSWIRLLCFFSCVWFFSWLAGRFSQIQLMQNKEKNRHSLTDKNSHSFIKIFYTLDVRFFMSL